MKQIRLFAYWGHFLAYIAIFTALVVDTTGTKVSKIETQVEEYEICVLMAGDDSDCKLEVDVPSFAILLCFHICTGMFPISTFLVFGTRRELYLFWKEYLLHCWKHKRLTLSFVPSFDPSTNTSTSINSLDEAEAAAARLRKSVREL